MLPQALMCTPNILQVALSKKTEAKRRNVLGWEGRKSKREKQKRTKATPLLAASCPVE